MVIAVPTASSPPEALRKPSGGFRRGWEVDSWLSKLAEQRV
jgi:hypothetical protein